MARLRRTWEDIFQWFYRHKWRIDVKRPSVVNFSQFIDGALIDVSCFTWPRYIREGSSGQIANTIGSQPYLGRCLTNRAGRRVPALATGGKWVQISRTLRIIILLSWKSGLPYEVIRMFAHLRTRSRMPKFIHTMNSGVFFRRFFKMLQQTSINLTLSHFGRSPSNTTCS